jgi:hypothetical protein
VYEAERFGEVEVVVVVAVVVVTVSGTHISQNCCCRN